MKQRQPRQDEIPLQTPVSREAFAGALLFASSEGRASRAAHSSPSLVE